MAAQQAAPQLAPARDLELLSDCDAFGVACLALGEQVRAGLEHERLDLLCWAADHERDLLLREAAQLGQQQCRTLVFGQLGDVGQQLAQIRALLKLCRKAVDADALELLVSIGERVSPRAKHRSAAVAGDREQPRPRFVWTVAAQQRPVSADERLLKRVLTVLAIGEHVPAKRQQRRVVAVIQRGEGRGIAGTGTRGKAGIVELGEWYEACEHGRVDNRRELAVGRTWTMWSMS